MSEVPQQYSVAAGSAATDRERAVAVWLAGGFGDPVPERQRERFTWLYQQCPHGEGQVNFLHVAGQPEPVGFLGVSLRQWSLDGHPAHGGSLVDFVVLPEHRSAAPALQLQRRGRDRASATAQILFGLPEPKAVAIFKRLGSTLQKPLTRHARVLRFAPYLRRRMPSWLASIIGAFADLLDGFQLRCRLAGGGLSGVWQEGFDAGFDELWTRCARPGRCLGVRDQAFLNWRFNQQPRHRYRVFAVRSRIGGSLQMYFVCQQDGDTLVIKDLLAENCGGELAEGLARLCLAARKTGVSSVSVQLLADEQATATLRGAGFVERDARPFFGMVSDAASGRPAASAWYITQADEDN